jgi:hypothetical protein
VIKPIIFYRKQKPKTKEISWQIGKMKMVVWTDRKRQERLWHHERGTKLWYVWLSMKQRCLNPRNKDYPYYGGRGITVCDRWLVYKNFRDDMGQPPFKGAMLEREENNGNYEPGNCRWATRLEQARNRRDNKAVVYGGHYFHTLKQAAEFVGIDYGRVKARINNLGWSVERALSIKNGNNCRQRRK